MDTEQLLQIVTYAFIAVASLMFGLILAYIIMLARNKMKQNEKEANALKENGIDVTSKTANSGFEKQSILNFMEFDTVDDNMIIQKDGTRFLMVIECQGVNYDLMSGVEKTSVEEGFVQFLNTLRNPIQIYIQTRTVNLENSISAYKEKLKKVEDKFNRMKMQYYEMQDSGQYTKEQLDRAFYELTKQSNLYEYGRDVINDTERMNLNKNVLNKKYYIIVPYYASELGSNDLDKAEIKNLAFSEIYTRAQSLISSISACGVKGKILRTNELIELLYMAYNRDEAETFGLEKALRAGYNELYSTAPDVYEKKMKELDKIIEEKAMQKAKEKIKEAKSELERRAEETEKNVDSIVDDVVRMLLEENEPYIGKEVKDIALEKLESTEEGGKTNGKKTRRRKNANV